MEFVRILSVSQEEQFKRVCPHQYYLQRVKRIPTKEGPELRFGIACHEVLKTLHRAYRSGVWLPTDFLMSIFRSHYRPFSSRHAEFQARKLLGIYVDQLLPELVPKLIEEQFYLDIAPGVVCTGVIDLYSTSRIIMDFKFRGKVKKDPNSLQEICYWLGIQSILGPTETIDGYWRLTFVRKSAEPGCYRLVRERLTLDMEKARRVFYDRMRRFASDLKYAYMTKAFPKNPKTRLCHPRWCAYYDTYCDHRAYEDAEPYIPAFMEQEVDRHGKIPLDHRG